MNIKKRNPDCKSVKDVVLSNVGMTECEFLYPDKVYTIDKIKEAKELLSEFGNSGKLITIVGDYDADGICASAILSMTFSEMGWKHIVRLPKRFSEGYGLSEDIIDELEVGLLITVDNGIAATDAIKKAKDRGFTVIVTDHHLPDADSNIPPADIVIDPNAIENTATFNGYCGAGLAYKLSVNILGEKHPLIPKLLSLATIATVADVMPLIEDNRNIVKNGLITILDKKSRTLGLGAILSRFGIEKYISAKDIAFKIGPAINAPGRMFDNGANISLETLICDDSLQNAIQRSDFLYEINNKRKDAKVSTLQILRQNIKDNHLENDCPLIVYEVGLPEGLIGIFAGNLAEEYKVPCIVLTDTEDENILKGSGRTYGNTNIKELLDRNNKFLIKYGGHADAVGISAMHINELNNFKNALQKDFNGKKTVDDDTIYYDLEIDATEINKMFSEIAKYEPYGQGNPEIVFLIKNFDISSVKYMQNGQTVKFTGKDASAICFDMGDEYRFLGEPKIIDIVGVLNKNSFKNFISNQIEVSKIIPHDTKTIKTPMAQMLEDIAKQNSIKNN